MRALNEQYDRGLLSSRNKNPDIAQALVDEAMSASRRRVTEIFTVQQQERLRQITYRLRGISFVLAPNASQELGLSRPQFASIEEITTRSRESVAAEQRKLADGQTTQKRRSSKSRGCCGKNNAASWQRSMPIKSVG